MKKCFLSLIVVLSAVLTASAQDIVYYNADSFPVFGKAVENTSARYTRFPAEYEQISRKALWDLSLNSTGIYVRFRSDTDILRIKWASLHGFRMNHMTDTGIRGIDVYTMVEGKWTFLGNARPDFGKEYNAKVISGMEPQMREYMLYLSLYEGVKSLEIGIGKDAVIGMPEVNSPVAEHPVVMYGTSILQGGCASRPGMAYTNIIERRLDRQVINLGFSGNGKLDMEVAELIAKVKEPSVIVLDHCPNNYADAIAKNTPGFFRVIRDAHPDVPVVFVENSYHPQQAFVKATDDDIKARNEAIKKVFEDLLAQGEKNIYYVTNDNLTGTDREETVDGGHFTDLGMVRYADAITPLLSSLIAK